MGWTVAQGFSQRQHEDAAKLLQQCSRFAEGLNVPTAYDSIVRCGLAGNNLFASTPELPPLYLVRSS